MNKSVLRELPTVKGAKKIVAKTFVEAFPSLLQIGLLFVVFVMFNFWYRALTEIHPNNFNEIVLATSPTQFFEGSIWLLAPVVFIVGLMVWRRGVISVNWKSIQGGNTLRLIVGSCIVVLSWAHISFPFSYFLLENIFLERFIVFVLACLVIWRPYFLILYVLFPILAHFGEPLMVNHWSITELPIRVIMLFSAQLMVWLVFPKSKWKIGAFIFLLLCVLAGNYFPAGFGKLKMGWLTDNQIYLLLSNMYADGWVGFLSQETLSDLTRFLSKYNLLLKIGCLVMEFGCVFILVRKNWSVRFFLLGFLLFHTLVFIMTGILFWPWITLEIAMLVALRKKDVISLKIKQFSVWHIMLSMCLIFTSSRWLRPSVYVWYDSPLNYTYHFEVEDTSGKTSILPTHYFWPKYYEMAWTNGFHFTHQNPTLNIIWGVSFDGREVQKLLTFNEAEDVFAFEKKYGKNRYNPRLTKEFRRYMADYVKDKKYKLALNPWLKAISAPPQRLIFPADDTYNGEYDIVKINAYQKLSLFNGKQYKELRNIKVLTIDIPE